MGSTNTQTMKTGITITTVAPENNQIEGVTKTGAAVNVVVTSVPIAWRWPVVGEAWIARQENGLWYLDGPRPDPNSTAEVQLWDIETGDAIVNSPTGVVHVMGSEDGSSDFAFTASDFANPYPSTTNNDNYQAAVMALSPLSYYRLGDAVGQSVAVDQVGYYPGTYKSNNVAYPLSATNTGKISPTPDGGVTPDGNGAMFFLGDSTCPVVDCGNATAQQLYNGTIHCWFRQNASWNPAPETTPYQGIFGKNFGWMMFILPTGSLGCYDWGTATNRDSGIYISDGHWHHIAMTFQSGVTNGTTIILDGQVVLITTITVLNQTASVTIGSQTATGSATQCNIDEAVIHPSVLSVAQINSIIDTTKTTAVTAAPVWRPQIPPVRQPGIMSSRPNDAQMYPIVNANGTISYTMGECGPIWIADYGGGLVPIWLPAQTITLTPPNLPTPGTYRSYGLEVNTQGVFSLRDGGANEASSGAAIADTDNLPPFGLIRLHDTVITNTSGVYSFAFGLDRRPWAEGAHAYTRVGQDTTTSTAPVLLGSGPSASLRVEVSGLCPVRITLTGTASNNTTNAYVAFYTERNGISLGFSVNASYVGTYSGYSTLAELYDYDTYGTSAHYQIFWASPAGGTSTISNAVMSVEELRPTGNNGYV